MATLLDVSGFLEAFVRVSEYSSGPHVNMRAPSRPIARLGVAREPADAISLPQVNELDALLLHRWWRGTRTP